MKLHVCLIIILIPICTQSFGQYDSLKNEILKNEDTTAVTIKKGRQLLLESFQKNHPSKVQQIFNYLTKKVDDGDYLALYPIEQVLINYWLGQYNEIDSEVLKYTEDYFKKNDKKSKTAG